MKQLKSYRKIESLIIPNCCKMGSITPWHKKKMYKAVKKSPNGNQAYKNSLKFGNFNQVYWIKICQITLLHYSCWIYFQFWNFLAISYRLFLKLDNFFDKSRIPSSEYRVFVKVTRYTLKFNWDRIGVFGPKIWGVPLLDSVLALNMELLGDVCDDSS